MLHMAYVESHIEYVLGQTKLYKKKKITRNLHCNLTNPNNDDVKLYMIEVGELFQKKKKKKILKWGDCDILDTNFRGGKIGHHP